MSRDAPNLSDMHDDDLALFALLLQYAVVPIAKEIS
jgi:hypothetical protein